MLGRRQPSRLRLDVTLHGRCLLDVTLCGRCTADQPAIIGRLRRGSTTHRLRLNSSFSPFLGRSRLLFSSKTFPYSENMRSENTDEEGELRSFRESSRSSGNSVPSFHHSRESVCRGDNGCDKNRSTSFAASARSPLHCLARCGAFSLQLGACHRVPLAH